LTDFAEGGVTSSSQLLMVSANAAKRLLWDFVSDDLSTTTISQHNGNDIDHGPLLKKQQARQRQQGLSKTRTQCPPVPLQNILAMSSVTNKPQEKPLE